MIPFSAPLRAWLFLMALSVAMGFFADVQTGRALGPLMLSAIGIVVIVKAHTILADYMGLREFPAVRLAFIGALAFVIVIVTGAFILVPN